MLHLSLVSSAVWIGEVRHSLGVLWGYCLSVNKNAIVITKKCQHCYDTAKVLVGDWNLDGENANGHRQHGTIVDRMLAFWVC